jgi:hypothetical protein
VSIIRAINSAQVDEKSSGDWANLATGQRGVAHDEEDSARAHSGASIIGKNMFVGVGGFVKTNDQRVLRDTGDVFGGSAGALVIHRINWQR